LREDSFIVPSFSFKVLKSIHGGIHADTRSPTEVSYTTQITLIKLYSLFIKLVVDSLKNLAKELLKITKSHTEFVLLDELGERKIVLLIENLSGLKELKKTEHRPEISGSSSRNSSRSGLGALP
jgi:hypothetical protein